MHYVCLSNVNIKFLLMWYRGQRNLSWIIRLILIKVFTILLFWVCCQSTHRLLSILQKLKLPLYISENVIWSLVHYPFGSTARLLIHVSFWGRERRMAFVDWLTMLKSLYRQLLSFDILNFTPERNGQKIMIDTRHKLHVQLIVKTTSDNFTVLKI